MRKHQSPRNSAKRRLINSPPFPVFHLPKPNAERQTPHAREQELWGQNPDHPFRLRNDEDKWVIFRSLDVTCCCQHGVKVNSEDPEPRSQSSSETINCEWEQNVNQLLLCNISEMTHNSCLGRAGRVWVDCELLTSHIQSLPTTINIEGMADFCSWLGCWEKSMWRLSNSVFFSRVMQKWSKSSARLNCFKRFSCICELSHSAWA